MNIGIIGSGIVGQTLGAALAGKGHAVVVGTRDAGKLRESAAKTGGRARAASFADAAAHGEIVMNATSGRGSLEALRMAGAGALKGKILIDIANPLDFSRGFPPRLFLSNTESLGEQIQAAFPDTRVVKTLNTVSSVVMVDPGKIGGGDHALFVCGNDEAAKTTVTELLGSWFGWKHVVDLGDITSARGTEMYLPLWVRLYGKMKTPAFNIRIVT
ncbi:MAG: NADPH-dependent F420 reductase [Spirochaetia bacterium]